MSGKPTEPDPTGPPRGAAGESAEPTTEESAAPERIGPLVLERLNKADGRSLIIYSNSGSGA